MLKGILVTTRLKNKEEDKNKEKDKKKKTKTKTKTKKKRQRLQKNTLAAASQEEVGRATIKERSESE